MGFTRTTYALIGTDATSGATLGNNSTTTGTTFDVLGDGTSAGDAIFYLCFTSSLAAGTLDIKINSQNTSSTIYSKGSFEFSITPIVGTIRIPLCRRAIGRYLNVEVRNSGVGASLTNVTILAEVEKAA